MSNIYNSVQCDPACRNIAGKALSAQHAGALCAIGVRCGNIRRVKDLKITNTLDVPIMIYAKTKKNRLIFEVKSYKNALKGYQYKPRAVQLSSVSAKAYLDI